MPRTNFMQSRGLVERVAKYASTRIDNDQIRIHYNVLIRQSEESLKSLENLRLEGKNVDSVISDTLSKISEYKKAMKDGKKSFTWQDCDKECYKDFYSDDEGKMGYYAIEFWAKCYGLDLAFRDCEYLVRHCGGSDFSPKSKGRQFCRTGNAAKHGMTQTQFLDTLYSNLHDLMVAKNAINPAVFPEEVRDYYMTKKEKEAKSAK